MSVSRDGRYVLISCYHPETGYDAWYLNTASTENAKKLHPIEEVNASRLTLEGEYLEDPDLARSYDVFPDNQSFVMLRKDFDFFSANELITRTGSPKFEDSSIAEKRLCPFSCFQG